MEVELQPITNVLNRQPRWAVVIFALTGVVSLALLDYLTGPDVAFSIFYLAPIAVTASSQGFRASVVVAVASALAWAVADAQAADRYSSMLVPIWNSFARFGIFLIVGGLVASQRRQVAREKELARVDSLTGVGNLRAFEERARIETERMRRYGGSLTVAYLDLDDFKRVNDELGHAAGDDVLRRIALELESSTRSTDLVARLGGDEFAILLPATDREGAAILLNHLRHRVAEVPTAVGRRVSYALGAVTYHSVPDSVDEMISAADRLMYEGKRGGRDGLVQIEIGMQGRPAVVRVDGTAPRRESDRSEKP